MSFAKYPDGGSPIEADNAPTPGTAAQAINDDLKAIASSIYTATAKAAIANYDAATGILSPTGLFLITTTFAASSATTFPSATLVLCTDTLELYLTNGVDNLNDIAPIAANYDLTRRAYALIERFEQTPGLAADTLLATGNTYTDAALNLALSKNQNWVISGTNATDAKIVHSPFGGITFTASAVGDTTILTPNPGTDCAWNTLHMDGDLAPTINFSVLSISTGNSSIWMGLKTTTTNDPTVDADQAYLLYDSTKGPNWYAEDANSNAATRTETDTGIAATPATKNFRIDISGTDLKPRYYINGTLVVTGQPIYGNFIPIPVIGIKKNGNPGNKTMTLQYIKARRNVSVG